MSKAEIPADELLKIIYYKIYFEAQNNIGIRGHVLANVVGKLLLPVEQ